MKRLVILMLLVMLVVSVVGCSETAKHSMRRNCSYLRDDCFRIAGLDQPSALFRRDYESVYAYTPYRPYD